MDLAAGESYLATSSDARRDQVTLEAPPEASVDRTPPAGLDAGRRAAPASCQRPRIWPRMPFMLVGTGPLGIGMAGPLGVERLEPVEDVGHLGRLHLAAELLHVARPAWAAAPRPRRCRRRPRGSGVSAATRSCLRRSVAISWLSRLGLPSPTRTMPGGPTTRWTTSCCLVNADGGLGLPAAAQHPQRGGGGRRADPPSGRTPPSGRGGRR